MKSFSTIILLLISLQCFSQVMVESTGEFYYNKNKVSKEEARDYALLDARVKAVEKAFGVDVTHYETVSVKNNRENLKSLSNIQTNAVVQVIESDFEYHKKFVKAKVKAFVQKTHGDSFIKVSGIKSRYSISDCIHFNVTFYENGYFYAFGLATEEKGVQLYPNREEFYKNYYTKNIIKTFPTRGFVSYIPVRREKGVPAKYLDDIPNKGPNKIYFCDSGRYNSNMLMFFVLLKSPHPFKYEKVTYNNIVKWYLSIPEEDKNGMEIKVFSVEE